MIKINELRPFSFILMFLWAYISLSGWGLEGNTKKSPYRISPSTSKVKITFEDGKTCTDITDASVGFKHDEKRGCYFTETYIEPGGTASLQFTKKGNVEYIVDAEGRSEKPKGQIKVAD